jgi:repressor LexA
MQTVTPRQLQVLQFIRDYRKRSGYSPTMQEIGDQLGLTKVTVFEHAEALERKGLLTREGKHRARSLQVSPRFRFPDEDSARLPLVGLIAAGAPIEAIEDRQALDLQDMFRSAGERFVLKVAGESMIDEHIRDGDYVICQRTSQARNGDTVVALLPNGEATLKRFYREKGRIRLQPANPRFAPLFVQDVDIQGVVIGVVRRV